MSKLALNVAMVYAGVENLEELAFRGGTVRLLDEPSPEDQRSRVTVVPEEKEVIVRFPESVREVAANEFYPDAWTTVAQGVTLCEAGVREPEMFRRVDFKNAVLEVAGKTSTMIIREMVGRVDPSIVVDDVDTQLR